MKRTTVHIVSLAAQYFQRRGRSYRLSDWPIAGPSLPHVRPHPPSHGRLLLAHDHAADEDVLRMTKKEKKRR